MRTAIISDIHGNYDGLRAVFQDIDSAFCDRIICLGDLVEGGDDDVTVVRCIRDRNIPTVRGNHDEINGLSLPPNVSDFLRSLPESIRENDVLFTHISPRRRKAKILDGIEAWNVFDETDARLIFVGHVHLPIIFGERCSEAVSATEYPTNMELALDATDRYIVCVGAVGYSRDMTKRLRYTIYDSDRETLEMRSLDGPLLPFG